MTREYILKEIRNCEDRLIDLENEIKKEKTRKKRIEKQIELLNSEKLNGSELFSPRDHRAQQNSEKLNAFNYELDQIEEELERKIHTYEQLKEQRVEYDRLLKSEIGEKRKEIDDLVNDLAEEEETESEQIEDFVEDPVEENIIQDFEVKSGELIVLESERKKEKEFLSEVYSKIELCLAMLNGNKNICKSELLKVKRMIQDYVKSIEIE